MGTYRISELAERSGVPATTLRYYEAEGLLLAGRTSSGYRVYDETSAQRLEFIPSAKMLGLALEEIRELLAVWDSGVCAHVRDGMLPLVTQRIEDADRRRAELAAFSARLAQVHAMLAMPAPKGACGPACGCVVEGGSGPVLVELVAAHADDRTRRWRRLLTQASAREELPDGVRVVFPLTAALVAEVADWAAAQLGEDGSGGTGVTLHLTTDWIELTVRIAESGAAMLADVAGLPA
ncbi:heavy metal-responsive transcriptional regulator [Jiangella alkaliphila]|uniref:DNA-binding transcriptional regulator, MerR family n=1 Tax=Jiangella alkaliphila TaxID=419479 RepID=A0A1H2H2A8_9ACTN|nr:heavy metal-responsive transcriptional regulator [Jiangella alkaliphila]SDU26017.1 DNA-binding transcriptional regulator, MerR family [Jiangella alkaliphila]